MDCLASWLYFCSTTAGPGGDAARTIPVLIVVQSLIAPPEQLLHNALSAKHERAGTLLATCLSCDLGQGIIDSVTAGRIAPYLTSCIPQVTLIRVCSGCSSCSGHSHAQTQLASKVDVHVARLRFASTFALRLCFGLCCGGSSRSTLQPFVFGLR